MSGARRAVRPAVNRPPGAAGGETTKQETPWNSLTSEVFDHGGSQHTGIYRRQL